MTEEMEKGKLVTFLNYLIEHNGEHSEELRELAEKVDKGTNDVARDEIRAAARLMNESTEYLKKALMKLSKD